MLSRGQGWPLLKAANAATGLSKTIAMFPSSFDLPTLLLKLTQVF